MTNPAPFISTLQAIFDSGYTALGFTEAQLFRLANCRTQPQHRMPYSAYRNFVEHHGSDDFMEHADPMLNALQQIYVVIEGNTLGQQQMMIQEVSEDKPNWRRLTWLVNKRLTEERMAMRKADKKERAERAAAKMAAEAQKAAQKATTAKPVEENEAPVETSKPTVAPTQPQAAEVVAETTQPQAAVALAEPATAIEPEQSPAPEAQPVAEAATKPTVAPLTKEALQAKWYNRFRPDWPWSANGKNSLFVSVKQLRAIEAEIAAERAAGAPELFPNMRYQTTKPEVTEGFFQFRKNNGKLPAVERFYTTENEKISKQIIAQLKDQQEAGLVVEDWA